MHFEDQLASERKCGHMGGKVIVPTSLIHDVDGRLHRGEAVRGRSARKPKPAVAIGQP